MPFAPKRQVAIHLTKWWSKYTPVNHVVTRTISPYNQDVLTPWIRTWPERLMLKVKDNFFDVVPPFLLGFGILAWGNATYHREQVKQRD